ncbi:hypothetical protein [Streptomyces tateyamensis]|nr:hypothetical protein [Streptomyces tateyamensis]
MTTSATVTVQSEVTALTGTLAAVYTELYGYEAVTATDLARAAEVSLSATRKALTTLEQRGLAWRTPGGNDGVRRLPDHWHPVTPDSGPSHADQATTASETAEAETELPSDSDKLAELGPGDDGAERTPEEQAADEEADVSNVAEAVASPAGPDLAGDQPMMEELPTERMLGHTSAEAVLAEARDQADDGPAPAADFEDLAPQPGDGADTDQKGPAGEVNDALPGAGALDTIGDADDSGLTDALLDAEGDQPEDGDGDHELGAEAGEAEPVDSGARDGTPDSTGEDTVLPAEGGAAPEEPAEHVCVCSTCGTHLRPRARKRAVTTTGGGYRLAPGELHQMVLGHLQANPEQDWTPTKISQVLGRSSGAIANAMATMVSRGEAVQTSAQPRRYQAAPAGTAE